MKKENNENWLLDSVKSTNKNPDKLTEEGKRDLAHDVIEEMSEGDINKFLKEWGYKKE